MKNYRVYEFSRNDRIISAADIQCADDHAAIGLARATFNAEKIEVWDGDRMVTSLVREELAPVWHRENIPA